MLGNSQLTIISFSLKKIKINLTTNKMKILKQRRISKMKIKTKKTRLFINRSLKPLNLEMDLLMNSISPVLSSINPKSII